ncbi:DUF2442 domain-containing protein [Paraburkholderia sp. J11-2]|uniref:DUF2442 domain-containing protein n=1 Tax=Paraburkholderia sp. J11-2 TaxID=2805431 RepID=UPI002AB63555|nr:DUF2442 domain-containing protein [Paraburkholderia sp. J11-2]
MVSISKKQIAAAREAGAQSPVAVSARYSRVRARLEIEFANDVAIGVPVALIQELQSLERAPTAAQLAEVEIWGGGQSLYFPRLDLLLWAPGLLQGVFGTQEWMRELARAMGSSTSPAKAAAARANGRKGGRPRKQPGDQANDEPDDETADPVEAQASATAT